MTMIGTLRFRVILESPARIAEDGGAASYSWSSLGSMFARIKPIAGREIVAADGTSARVTHEVTLRHRDPIDATMRFIDGTRVLEIRAVLDMEGRRRWLRCLCEERLA